MLIVRNLREYLALHVRVLKTNDMSPSTKSLKRTNMDDLALLKTVPLLSFLPDPTLGDIRTKLIEQHYEKGEFIFREGDKAEWFYFLKQGAIKCLKYAPQGDELILKILLPGEMFCCESVTFEGDTVHPGNAQAMGPTTVLKLNRTVYFECLHQHPPVTMQVISYLGNRLKESQDLAKSLALDPAETRLAALLLRLAEKLGVKEPDGVYIGIQLTRQEIAHMIAVTEETAVRILTRFKEQGVLLAHSGKKIIIADMDSLSKLAS